MSPIGPSDSKTTDNKKGAANEIVKSHSKMTTVRKPGYGTEYSDNYTTDKHGLGASSWNKESSGLFDGKALGSQRMQSQPSNMAVMGSQAYTTAQSGAMTTGMPVDPLATGMPTDAMATRDPAVFPSQIYPSVYRETVIHKDDRGKYIDPFKNIANKPYGRRLMYDPSHPDKMYASQWSSELADHSGCYSFPTTTGLEPDIPFKQDLQWQAEGEIGSWPTDKWKGWIQVASSPPYDGHDDQLEYSKYKVHVP